MFALFRLVLGRRIVVLLLLAMLAAAGSPALREKASRLLACGVSLPAGDPTGGLGASAASAIPGTRISRSSPAQCLRAAIATTPIAKRWMPHSRAGE